MSTIKQSVARAEDGTTVSLSAADVSVTIRNLDHRAIDVELERVNLCVDSRDLRKLAKLFKALADSLESRGLGVMR